ncbi:hypothetical protein DFH09DRAFT_1316724 [Mycena vulgaris]|nr:hypothetical protein DFH09DRAFT_1316724 [Mycena vulgaris]
MPLVLAWLALSICIVQVAIARILLSNPSSQPSQVQFPSDGSVLLIASAMGELSDESETSDEGITQGFLGCGLGSPDGVGLSTNSGINNTGIDAVYASLLWYLFVERNATSGAEGYRMYCTPTSNGTRIMGHDDSPEKLLTVAVGPQANLTSKVETEGRTYPWNITQIEFPTSPPFGIPQRLYTICPSGNGNCITMDAELGLILAPLVVPVANCLCVRHRVERRRRCSVFNDSETVSLEVLPASFAMPKRQGKPASNEFFTNALSGNIKNLEGVTVGTVGGSDLVQHVAAHHTHDTTCQQTSTMKQSYELKIMSVSGIHWKPAPVSFGVHRIPNLYVAIDVDDKRVYKTHTSRNWVAVWNHLCTLSAPSPSSLLALQILHKPLFGDGEYVPIALTDMSEDPTDGPRPILVVRMTAISHIHGGAVMIDDAIEAIKPLQDEAARSAVVDLVGRGVEHRDLLSAFGTVLSGLAIVVRIGAEVAKIHPYADAAFKVLTSVYAAVKNQKETDERIFKLVQMMANVYSGQHFLAVRCCGRRKEYLAISVSERFRGLDRLGAFLFFNRLDQVASNPGSVIRTIAFWLAGTNNRVASAICAAIAHSPALVNASIERQFKELLFDPLTAAQDEIPGPIISILDALDECGDPQSRQSLVSLIANDFPKLPQLFRFFITSRPDSDIAGTF